jgi:predicted DsbA family dithiol-disulfide isomerase
VRIDIWSDVVCPWCYLGHHRFSAALELLPAFEADIAWHAFELDPRAPRDPYPVREVYERKYGPDTYESMTNRLVTLGADAGIDFRFDLAQRANTLDAHRVIAWSADEPHGQDPVIERLFRAYFTEGRNIADTATLAELVADIGGDADAVGELLASHDYVHDVRADEQRAREYEITGVPAFVVAERLMIPGAQEVDTMVRVLERAQERFN